MNTLFAERLKIALDRKNMKQIDLVHRALQQGVKLGKSHVSQYLSGKTMPRPEILRFLAATLEVDEKWLQGIGEDMELPETERFVQKNMPDFTVTGRIENATKPASQVLPEREKENYGMKKNSKNKTKKGGIKLNMNLFPKSKKSTNSSKNHKDNDVIRSEQIANIKEEESFEEINNSEE